MSIDADKAEKALKAVDLYFTEGSYEQKQSAVRLVEEALTPEPKFYAGQSVLVRDFDTDDWTTIHLVSIRDNEHGYIFHAAEGNYKQCKPNPDTVSHPNWIEHNGDSDMPIMDDVWVEVVLVEQQRSSGRADNFEWGHVLRYTITPLPEFLE